MWFSALETLNRLKVAFSSTIENFKALPGAYEMWSKSGPGTKRAIEWALGICGAAVVSFVFLLAFPNPLGKPLANAPSYSLSTATELTPYRLLGVTTTSSTTEITEAYCELSYNTLTSKSFGWFAGGQLAAYRSAYETIADPLLRCNHHLENGIPDWYGFPSSLMCWLELTIKKLEAAKGAVRTTFGSDHMESPFDELYHIVETCADNSIRQ